VKWPGGSIFFSIPSSPGGQCRSECEVGIGICAGDATLDPQRVAMANNAETRRPAINTPGNSPAFLRFQQNSCLTLHVLKGVSHILTEHRSVGWLSALKPAHTAKRGARRCTRRIVQINVSPHDRLAAGQRQHLARG